MLNLMLYLQRRKQVVEVRYGVVDVETASYCPDNLASWLPLRTFPAGTKPNDGTALLT